MILHLPLFCVFYDYNFRKGKANKFEFVNGFMRVKLEDVCLKGSSNLKQSDVIDKNGEYEIYGASGLIGKVDFFHQEKPYIAVVKDGAGIGRTMLLPEKSSVIGTMQYILPNEKVTPKYLYYVIRYMHLEKYFTGATIPHIYFKDYRKEEFNLCDLLEQEKIVSTLSKIETLITHFRTQLEKLDLLVKARFVEMFGDIYTNKYDLPICPLSDYITFLTSGSRGWAKYCTENGTDWFITIKNVKACKITTHNIQQLNAPDNMEAKRTKVQEDDLLISITADLGRTGVVTKEIAEHGAYINQHLTCVRLNKSKITPIYAAYFMESNSGRPQFEAKNQTGVKAGLNFDSIYYPLLQIGYKNDIM